MKILLIDDSPMQQKIARIYIEKGQGHKLFTADNGVLGIDAAKSCDPDLILLDVEMPIMGGEETLRVLKADAVTKKIPVIMCTASEEDEDVYCRQGADGLLIKPHGFSSLKKNISDYVRTNEEVKL